MMFDIIDYALMILISDSSPTPQHLFTMDTVFRKTTNTIRAMNNYEQKNDFEYLKCNFNSVMRGNCSNCNRGM